MQIQPARSLRLQLLPKEKEVKAEMSEVWVKCPECGKDFDNYPELIAHMESHVKKKVMNLMKIKSFSASSAERQIKSYLPHLLIRRDVVSFLLQQMWESRLNHQNRRR
jgi:acetyl-CoA carboxylase beta subunit